MGLTIGEFARKVGYSWSQVQRMEKGVCPVSERVVMMVENMNVGYFKK